MLVTIRNNYQEDYTTNTVEVNSKEDLLAVVGKMYDAIAEKNNAGKKTEDEFWSELLDKTVFANKEEFWDWMSKMEEHGLQVREFKWDDFLEEVVDDAVSMASDYNSLGELIDRVEECERALSDVYELVRYFN